MFNSIEYKKIKEKFPHVNLIAVSKTKPIEDLQEAMDCGQMDFGENYVQELIEKQKQFSDKIHWHFIGHLQSNKVKQIVGFVHLIHSVDSLNLLLEINKQGQKINRVINCLLQIYVGNEETKYGLSLLECEQILNSNQFTELKNIQVLGFMAMASNTEDEVQIKNEFKALKLFQEKILSVNSNFKILCMGMSHDYELAIECGSNMVRIGSKLFGERNYKAT